MNLLKPSSLLLIASAAVLSSCASTTPHTIKRTAVVAAPVEKSWQVIGEDFANISKWASTVPSSRGTSDGGKLTGRVCRTELGDITETLTLYSPETYTVAYDATASKVPGFVTSLSNRWTLSPHGKGETRVDMVFEASTKSAYNFMWPLMEKKMATILDHTIEDYKHYLETGQPHPRKLSQLAQGQ